MNQSPSSFDNSYLIWANIMQKKRLIGMFEIQRHKNLIDQGPRLSIKTQAALQKANLKQLKSALLVIQN